MKVKLAHFELTEAEERRVDQAERELMQILEGYAARPEDLNRRTFDIFWCNFIELYIMSTPESFFVTVAALLQGLKARRELELTCAARLANELQARTPEIIEAAANDPLFVTLLENELPMAQFCLEEWQRNAHGFHLQIPADLEMVIVEVFMITHVAAALQEAECHSILVDYANAQIEMGNPPQADIFRHNLACTTEELHRARLLIDKLRKEAAHYRIRAKAKERS